MFSYKWYRDIKRSKNLKPDNICLLKYDGKIKEKYHYYHVQAIKPDKNCVVRTLEAAIRPKMSGGTVPPFQNKVPGVMTVGIQGLVLIVPMEELI